MCMAAAFMLVIVAVQSNHCLSGSECLSADEPQSLVSLLQTQLRSEHDKHHNKQEVGLPRILHVCSRSEGDFDYETNWKTKNPGWSIDYLTDDRIEDLFKRRFPTKALDEVAKAGVEKADIGRYLAIEAEGGVYVDNDVDALVPIDQWAKRFQHGNDIDVILGVEYIACSALARDGCKEWGAKPLQITQWTIAAKPNNPMMRHALDKIVEEAPRIADTERNILVRTGPGAFTSAVFSYLSGHGLKLPNMIDFNNKEGHLFQVQEKGHVNKVLILPYRAFGFRSGQDEFLVGTSSDRLVQHMFAQSWTRQKR